MTTVNFATTNKQKLQIAQTVCEQFGIKVNSVALDIIEIQGEDAEQIVKDKAQKAYQIYGKPVIVSDDSWSIRALNGFPGAYMKSINHWFTPQDFLRLMHGIEDRQIILHQYLAYVDGKEIKIFQNDVYGQIALEARGNFAKSPNMSIIQLDADNGKTVAEVFEAGHDALAQRFKNRTDAWHKFLDWYTKQ